MRRHKGALLILSGAIVVLVIALATLTITSQTTAATTATPNSPTAVWPPPPAKLPPGVPTPQIANVPLPPAPASFADVVQPTIGPQEGIPSIKPTLKTSDPKAATFTEQDVRNYYAQVHDKQHPNSPMPVIAKVTFMTVAQASSNQSIGLTYDQNELVCVVQITASGTLPGQIGQKPQSYTTVLDVFSAHTGNLLAETFR